MDTLLLVEDDQNLSFILKENLEDLGYTVYLVRKGEDALQLLEERTISLILMDVGLPGMMDGFDTSEEIRKQYPSIPILFTTARNTSKDIERGFGIAYVDYIKKPFGIKEVALRINMLLGDSSSKSTVTCIGSYQYDSRLGQLSRQGHLVNMTKMEASFLTMLCKQPGELIYKEQLIQGLWGDVEDPKTKERSLHSLTYKLRQYLKDDPAVSIEVISKSGYRIICP